MSENMNIFKVPSKYFETLPASLRNIEGEELIQVFRNSLVWLFYLYELKGLFSAMNLSFYKTKK